MPFSFLKARFSLIPYTNPRIYKNPKLQSKAKEVNQIFCAIPGTKLAKMKAYIAAKIALVTSDLKSISSPTIIIDD